MRTSAALTWVHVSDLHFGHGDAYYQSDQVGVTQAILRDAEAMCSQIGTPDLLVVTGDVAFSGQPAQYLQARQWLGELRKAVGDRARVLVVPGNHDIDRKHAEKLKHLGLRSEPRELDALLAEPSAMQGIWPKLDAFSTFAKEFDGCAIDSSRPFWKVELPDLLPRKLWVCGLNTALLCFDDKDAPGNLRLGRKQLLNAVEQIPYDALLLVLQHHPPEWLIDGPDLIQYLAQRPHIQFSGHVHKQQGVLRASLSGSAQIQFIAGAGHADRNESGSHAYSWGRLDASGLAYYSRVFLPDRQAFAAAPMLGSDDFLRGDHAFIEHGQLPKKLATWLGGPRAPSSPGLPPPGGSEDSVSRGGALSPALRASMFGCQQFFENNNERMVLAHSYKKIHDDLQEIEKYLNQCISLIRLFQRQITGELRFMMITNQLADMRTRILSVITKMNLPGVAAHFIKAVRDLTTIVTAIDQIRVAKVINEGENIFADRLSSVLTIGLTKANHKIVEIVRQLNFKDIRQQLGQLRHQLLGAAAAEARIFDLGSEAAKFEEVSNLVEHLSDEHSEWQIIDDWLRPIMNAPTPEFQRALFSQGLWAAHQETITTRCAELGELWAAELLQAQKSLVAQLADTQNNAFANALNEYYSKTNSQFCDIDKLLLSASESLFHSGQKIHMMLRGIVT